MTITGSYDLDLPGIVKKIRDEKARRVLIQLPDGLKPAADEIQAVVLKELPRTELFFWGGSVFGACDIPLHVDRLGFDLLIHLGHAPWR
jgi:2-(3-amino-3-carboxypropyl)histidine synthase